MQDCLLILLYLKCWPKNLLIMTMLSLRNKNKTNFQEGHGIPLFLGVELRRCVCGIWILLTPLCCPPPQLLGTCDPQPGRPGLTLGPLAQGNPSLWPTGTEKVRKPFPCRVSGCTPRNHSLSTDPPGIGQKPPCEAETPGTWLLSSCPLPGQHACLW